MGWRSIIPSTTRTATAARNSCVGPSIRQECFFTHSTHAQRILQMVFVWNLWMQYKWINEIHGRFYFLLSTYTIHWKEQKAIWAAHSWAYLLIVTFCMRIRITLFTICVSTVFERNAWKVLVLQSKSNVWHSLQLTVLIHTSKNTNCRRNNLLFSINVTKPIVELC